MYIYVYNAYCLLPIFGCPHFPLPPPPPPPSIARLQPRVLAEYQCAPASECTVQCSPASCSINQ